MFPAKLACPIPTFARRPTATVTEWFSPANPELLVRAPVSALPNHRSMEPCNDQNRSGIIILILDSYIMTTGRLMARPSQVSFGIVRANLGYNLGGISIRSR